MGTRVRIFWVEQQTVSVFLLIEFKKKTKKNLASGVREYGSMDPHHYFALVSNESLFDMFRCVGVWLPASPSGLSLP